MSETPATPVPKLLRAAEIGHEEGLHHVYPGNLPGRVGDGESTFCASCREPLVERRGFRVLSCRIGADGSCPRCGSRTPGIWAPGGPAVPVRGPGSPEDAKKA
jgi:pyruvate formate lyase activating enzyme